MSNIFAVIMAISLIWTFSTDRHAIKRLNKRPRYVYYAVNAVVIGLMLCMLFGIEVPLPNRFIIYDVSPWIYTQMKSN